MRLEANFDLNSFILVTDPNCHRRPIQEEGSAPVANTRQRRMVDWQQKGRHSLAESVALKAPGELLYDASILHHLEKMRSAEKHYSQQQKHLGATMSIYSLERR